MRLVFIAIIMFLACPNDTFGQAKNPSTEIRANLKAQENSWNNGNIPAFMEYYWKSDQLVFIGSKGPVYGWQATLDNYLKSYPDQVAMGKLTFEIRDVTKRSRTVYSVVGKFHLARQQDDLEGFFLLIWKKIKGKWVIVSDCTTTSCK